MRRYGFTILAMWETTNGSRTAFLCLLEWPDAETMADAWDRFLGI